MGLRDFHSPSEVYMELDEAVKNNPHLGIYLKNFQEQTGVLPSLIPQLSRDIDKKNINVIYPVGDPLFIHLYGTQKIGIKYYVIEPEMTQNEREKIPGTARNNIETNA